MSNLKAGYIVGIDEVGRGALAGNVTVAAILLPRNFQFSMANFQIKSKSKAKNLKLRDSKKLTPKQREIWFGYIKKELRLPYAVASVSPKKIDGINITQSANLAAGKALNTLIANCKLQIANCEVYLDGGLYIKKSKIKNQKSKLQFKNKNFKNLKTKTIIRGDEKIPAIAFASIIAKVSRDRQMKNLHKKYPQYGLADHKGYGTKRHFKAIKKYGPAKIHRLTFLKKMR